LLELTEKQKRFCDEYLIDLNATQAAIRAGYSTKTAKSIGQENLTKPYLKTYIDERLKKLENERIAKADEVLRYLTSIMRGEEQEEIVVVESDGDGMSSARKMNKSIGAKERIKAAELLGKRYGIFTDKVSVDTAIPVVIKGEDSLVD